MPSIDRAIVIRTIVPSSHSSGDGQIPRGHASTSDGQDGARTRLSAPCQAAGARYALPIGCGSPVYGRFYLRNRNIGGGWGIGNGEIAAVRIPRIPVL